MTTMEYDVDTGRVLQLNADYQPMRTISWRKALDLLLRGRAEAVSEYLGSVSRSVAARIAQHPAVIRLLRYVDVTGRLRFNRMHVFARDNYRCAYCNTRPVRRGRVDLEALSIDHVIPRAQAVQGQVTLRSGRKVSVTSWENVVCACHSCNARKADRTPEQAGMRLLRQPRVPTNQDVLRMTMRSLPIPTEWTEWLPLGTEQWKDYWTVELCPG